MRSPRACTLLRPWPTACPSAPRRGALPELVEATGGGVLVGPGDVNALADAVLALYRDPTGAAETGRRGEGVRRDFSAARMGARALEVYRSLAAGR